MDSRDGRGYFFKQSIERRLVESVNDQVVIDPMDAASHIYKAATAAEAQSVLWPT